LPWRRSGANGRCLNWPRSTAYIHPNLITNWKRQAVEGMASVFDGKAAERDQVRDAELKDLHAKIGQLVIERDFLAKASGR
jgi:transposase